MIFQEQKHVTVCALNCFCCYAMLELLVLLDNCVNDVCVCAINLVTRGLTCLGAH